MKKLINLLTVLVMVSVNVFTPFSYAGVETGAVIDIEEPVIEQSAIEEPITQTPEENKDDNISTSGSVLDIEKPEEPINLIEVIEPELPVVHGVESGNVVSMSGLNNDIENEHGTTELSGGNNIEEGNNYDTDYIFKLNNLEKEHTLNLLHSLTSEEIKGEGSYAGVKVEVYAQTGAFPSGTILSIVPITGDNDVIDIQDVLKEQKDVESTEKLIAFDISFLDKETKEELQPSTGTVQVIFNYEENEELKQAEEDETQEVKIYHLNDKDEEGEKIEEIKDVIVEEAIINEEESEEGVMVVEAESFSVYTIVVQVRDERPNNQLTNFEYEMISIARPVGLTDADGPIGYTIMDRNLGATRRGAGQTSIEAYGYHYQRGNNYGFDPRKSTSELSTSPTQVKVSGLTEYSGSTFIKGHNTWMKSPNNNLWTERGQGPCPKGWHIPTSSEWDNLYLYFNNTYPNGKFINYFYLPSAGKRGSSDGNLQVEQWGYYYGYLRFSTPHPSSDEYGYGLYFTSNYGNSYTPFGTYRADGLSIRCFKDTYAGDASNFKSIIFDYKGGVGSTALINVINGGTGTRPSDPIRNNSIFSGRYLLGTNTEFDFTGTIITGDITLYAKRNCEEGYQIKGNKCIENYYADTHVISFNTNGGSDKESIVVPGGIPMINAKYSHTPNIDDNGVQHGDFALNQDTKEIIKIDRADKIKINIVYETTYYYNHYVVMWDGSHPEYTATNDYSSSRTSKLGGQKSMKEYFVQGDTVTFGFKSSSNYNDYDGYKKYGYYAIIEDTETYFDFGENPIKEGSGFDGWYKENGERWNEYTDVVTGDITLYAHWRDPEAILLPGKDFNTKIKKLANNSTSYSYSNEDYKIKNIMRVDSIPSGVETIEIQAEDSDLPIYAWYKKGTIYIYAESDKIYLNKDSSYMFYCFKSLEDFEIDDLDTSKATDISYMFYYAQSLEDLNLSGWNIINVRNMNDMFYYCSSLKTLNLNGWNLSNRPSTSSMFYGLNSLKTLSLRNWIIPNRLSNGFYSSFGLSYSNALETIDVSNWNLSETTSLYQLFYQLYSLKSIIGLETWNTSNIESMYYLFAYCYNLENINVSGWNTSKVTDMSYMFYYCKSLEELNLSRRNTSAVTSTYCMFQYCESLESLNLDNRDFRKNTSTSSMFYRTYELKNLGTKNWKFGTNISNFVCNTSLGCQSDSVNYNKVKKIDVSGWTFSGTSLNGLFYNWNTLEEIKGLETLNTSGVTDMGSMFYQTSNIRHLNLSNWDTSSVTSMGSMFYGMSGLVELDLDSFDTSSLEYTNNMFYNTSNLKTIYVSDKFTTNSVTDSGSMFFGAKSIVGGNGTTYDANHIDAEYAKIDKPGTTGYFTNILDKPYNITYNLDGGILSGEKTIYTQRDTFTLKTPFKTGYSFLGWTGSNGDTSQTLVNILSGTFSGNLVFNANWEINQYTITFDTDGGTEIARIKQDYDTEVIAPEDPIKTGYSFTSWDKIIPNKMPAEDITITAQWEINQYTITFDTDGGTEITQIKQDYDTEVTAPEDPIKTGYSFTSWDKIIPNKMPAEDITITAQWGINQYTITFDTDGGNKLSDMKLDYNAKITNLPTPIKECNAFIGWKDLPENMPAHNITLKAMWNYTCSRSSGGGGGGNIKPEEDHGAAIQEPEKEESKVIDDADNQEDEELQEIKGKDNDKSSNEIKENDDTKNNVSSEEVSHNDYTQEQIEAYTFAKSNGITTTSSIEKSKMNTEITRIQMAKMLSNFAINVLGQEPDTSKGIVKFEDVTNKMDKQYDNAVTKSYQLGIMGQNVKNNEFRPNDEVTRAEFATALSRMLYNTDEGQYKGTSKYYEPHMAKLYNEGIITNTNPKMKEKRGYVMTMLMRSVNK